MTEDLNSKLTSRVGAVMLLREDGAILMQLRDCKKGLRRAGMWVPPGGHAESNESMESCARREFKEETNYDCSNLEFLMEFEDHVDGWAPYMLTVFWSNYDGIQHLKCLEGQELKFINREKAGLYDIPKYLLNVWDKAIAATKINDSKLW